MPYKVITAVATEPVTLAEARLHMKASDDTSEDALITAWITAAREIAEHYTSRALAPQTLELALDEFPDDEDNDGDIELPMGPAASITSIKYTDTAGAEQTITASDYALSLYGNARTVSLAYGKYWPDTQEIPDAVRVRYVTGYTTAPKAIKAAILLMVGWFYEHRGDQMDPNDIQPPAAKALLNTVKQWAF